MQSPAGNETLYIDDRELVKRTGLSRSYFQQLRARGKGPTYYRVSKRCLYLWSDVVAWLESQRVAGGK